MRKSHYTVTEDTKPERLDSFIAGQSNLTRSFIQKLIRQGLITVNLRKEKPGYRIREGDSVELTVPDQPEGILVPEDTPLNILWEDEHVIVVNKPPHMVMYPAAGNRSGTLMNAVASQCKKLASAGSPLRPGIVHRLDKDTSGAVVIAKDDLSYHDLVKQFRHREVEKHYQALLYGSLKADQGEINASIGRSDTDRKKMSTRAKRRKEAVTRYAVLKRFPSATLADIRIVTGRTHQIRVHFASLGHPVLGDRTYGRKTFIMPGDKKIFFSRQMLHAYSLKLRHPATGEVLECTAPVPEDMMTAIDELSA